jgi:hypothetical protein
MTYVILAITLVIFLSGILLSQNGKNDRNNGALANNIIEVSLFLFFVEFICVFLFK